MNWLFLVLIGPSIWAVSFALVYAVHGLGCARGWGQVATPLGPLDSVALIGLWGAGLAAGAIILLRAPKGPSVEAMLVRLGAWIGVTATALTLFPVLGLSSCAP